MTLLLEQPGVGPHFVSGFAGKPKESSAFGWFLESKDLVSTRHYTDSSDNPTWTTQTGSNAKTEIYTPSLGTGLNVTTTIQAGVATGSMQLHDLRGNTVTTINLTNNTASSWCSYDEFGNPDNSNPANTANINYTTYGQAQRATNTTSPDPIKGGNENSYTYPNDPITSRDFKGTNFWSDLAFNVGGAALTALACAATGGLGCLVAGVIIGATSGFLSKGVEWNELKRKPKGGQLDYMLAGAREGAVEGLIGHGVGKLVGKAAIKVGMKAVEEKTMAAVKRELLLSVVSEPITKAITPLIRAGMRG